MTRERRWQSLGHGGATLWFTGLPGAGKSTVAAAVEERLIAGRPAGVPARRRQPAPRPQRRPRLRRGRAQRERAAHRARGAGCSRSRGRSRWSASSAPTPPIARRPPRCTRPTTSASSRSSSTPRWSCASSATRRACTRARARASSPVSPASGRRTRRPPTPTSCSAAHQETVEEEVERVIDLLAARGLISPAPERPARPLSRRRPRQRRLSSRLCLGPRAELTVWLWPDTRRPWAHLNECAVGPLVRIVTTTLKRETAWCRPASTTVLNWSTNVVVPSELFRGTLRGGSASRLCVSWKQHLRAHLGGRDRPVEAHKPLRPARAYVRA